MRMRRKKTKTPITLHLSFGICSKLADICIPGRAREVQDPTAGGNQTRSSRNHGARRHQSRHQPANMFIVALTCLDPAKRLEAQIFSKSRNINTDVRILTKLG